MGYHVIIWSSSIITLVPLQVRDISERRQVSCRVVLLESGVLLAQQSDLFLRPLPGRTTDTSEDDKATSSPIGGPPPLPGSQQAPLCEKIDGPMAANLALMNLKDRKHLSLSHGSLSCANSMSSLPGSPVKRLSVGKRSSTPKLRPPHNNVTQDIGTGSRLPMSSDLEIPPDTMLDPKNKTDDDLASSSSRKTSLQTPQKEDDPLAGEIVSLPLKEGGLRTKGELKVLTFSTLEHLSSISVYAECPNTCLIVCPASIRSRFFQFMNYTFLQPSAGTD